MKKYQITYWLCFLLFCATGICADLTVTMKPDQAQFIGKEQKVPLECTACGGKSPYTYSWTLPDGCSPATSTDAKPGDVSFGSQSEGKKVTVSVTVTDADGKTATASQDVTVVKVEFDNMFGFEVNNWNFYQRTQNGVTGHQLGGSAKFPTQAKITPKEARSYVDIQLVQWKNTDVEIPNVKTEQTDDEDTAFNGLSSSTTYQNLDDDKLKLTGEDFPGYFDSDTNWGKVGSNSVHCTEDFNFNLYLQYRINGTIDTTDWATIGRMNWGLHGSVDLKVDSQGSLVPNNWSGGVDVVQIGSANTEDPQAPSAPKN